MVASSLDLHTTRLCSHAAQPSPSIRLRQFPTPRSRHPPIQIPSRFGKNQDQAIHDETRRKLERISGGFTAVRWGVAYGSGVFDQVGYASRGLNGIPNPDSPSNSDSAKPRKEKPLVDFLFSTSHPSHFHAINLQKNPTHYPRLFRWLGPEAIARVQEWGGGVWFVTDVDVKLDNLNLPATASGSSTSTSTTSEMEGSETVPIKYGIISTDALCTDLLDWTTLYVSGRLHKPVRIVKGAADRRVLVAAQVSRCATRIFHHRDMRLIVLTPCYWYDEWFLGKPDFGAPGCALAVARDVHGEGVVGTSRWDQLFRSVPVYRVVKDPTSRPILKTFDDLLRRPQDVDPRRGKPSQSEKHRRSPNAPFPRSVRPVIERDGRGQACGRGQGEEGEFRRCRWAGG